jgi:hypothetical protein
MSRADTRRLAEARGKLPELAMRLKSREAIRGEFLRMHADLMPVLGESVLSRWIWESLRQLKGAAEPEDGGQLPLFGNFSGEIRAREDWTRGDYAIYYRRYLNAAERNRAKLRLLAAEFEDRFGHGIDEAA